MEGSVSKSAVQYCNEELSLPCTEELDNNYAPIADTQLTVTWNAKTVISHGVYFNTSTPANGDHVFLCYATYTWRSDITVMLNETAFVVVRGMCFLMHATRTNN